MKPSKSGGVGGSTQKQDAIDSKFRKSKTMKGGWKYEAEEGKGTPSSKRDSGNVRQGGLDAKFCEGQKVNDGDSKHSKENKMHEANLGLQPEKAFSNHEHTPKAKKAEVANDIQSLAPMASGAAGEPFVGYASQRKLSDDYDFDNHLSD